MLGKDAVGPGIRTSCCASAAAIDACSIGPSGVLLCSIRGAIEEEGTS
jgi:hypothetical protein